MKNRIIIRLIKKLKNEKDDMRKIMVFLIVIALSMEEASVATATYSRHNITGFVTSAGVPLSDAHVLTGEYTVLTEADGSYSLSNLANGTYTVEANASEMIDNSTVVTINGSDQIANFSLVDNVPPSVISNTNNVYLANDTFIVLNATITDAGAGVKNANANVSALNSTINEAVLTLQGESWINYSIIADRGETEGFVDIVITAYDNAGNSNNTINMTVGIDDIPPFVASNTNKSYISNGNFSTMDADKPDLVMTLENISFSYVPSEFENGEVKENVNVTINATVYNSGLGNASNVNVSFYDGSPGPGNNIANLTITNISAGGSQNATINWTSIIGTHNISIEVDPKNTIAETDDSNNNASRTINVSGWQKYYGNISGNLILSDQAGNSFSNWSSEIPQGNVFISNIPSLNFNNFQALGRKKNGDIAQNNFSKADEFLNMTPGSNNATGFLNNNITELFSLNGTSPRNYTSFTVYGHKIDNVALVNSTNTTNFNSVETSPFITGILWDTTKDTGDGDFGDDGEDLVFITRINVNQTGPGNSSHNYESVIPSIIRNQGNVYFFVEVK